jgi:hypothetical protein
MTIRDVLRRDEDTLLALRKQDVFGLVLFFLKTSRRRQKTQCAG